MKPPTQTLLYQFPISHYCEKARWALDYKNVPYRPINLLPVIHFFTTRRLGSATSVPILVHEGDVIQDSPSIIDYLEDRFPDPPLIPEQIELAQQARDWERFADQEIGPYLRRYLYYYLLDSPAHMPKLILEQSSRYASMAFKLSFPLIKSLMKKGMRINPASAEKARLRLEKALEKLNREVEKKEFLAGKSFSRADLSVASLLSPLFTPPEHEFPWPAIKSLPSELQKFFAQWKDSPLEDWVLELYQRYRRPAR